MPVAQERTTTTGGPSRAAAAPTHADFLGLDDQALLARCDVDTYRASGPGGQKRNKTDSAVRLRLRGTDVMAVAPESRSQHENRARALRRLRRRIALQLRRAVAMDTYHSSETLARCGLSSGRLAVGRRDARYPPVVAELLDLLVACELRVSATAEKLGITTGALTTFLRRDADLLKTVNALRQQAGLRPVH